MRIRWRLALYGTTVVAAAMLVFVILLSALAGAAVPEEQDRALSGLAEQTVASLEAADGELPAAPLITVEADAATDAFVTIVAEDGSVRYSTGIVDDAPLRVPAAVVVEALQTGLSAATFTTGSTEVRIQARSWEPGADRDPLVVIAAQSTAFTEQQIGGVRALAVFAALVTLIAGAVVSWLVAGRALRPLRKLASTTDDIAATGDLSRRLPPETSRDEVGALTTSFNRMLDELERSQRRLADALDKQRRFVADASHELRSPLTTIRSNAGFLVDRPDADPDDRADALADIATESDRMTRLVDDLLILARADSDRLAEPRPLELESLLRDAGRRAERAGRPVEIHTFGPIEVVGDADGLDRLVQILVDNAHKHGAAPVSATLTHDGDRARLVVRDKGPGIPSDHLDHVFDRFHRVDAARSPTGSGLGLAIAREIVAGHDGEITAENDDGAVFTVTIPALQ